MDYAPDGCLAEFDEHDIAAAMQWSDDPGKLIESLLSCGGKNQDGFFECIDGGILYIHNWDENCGARFRQRSQAAERKRRQRSKKTRHDDVTRDMCVTHADVTLREERRGEEKRGDSPPTPPGGAGAVAEPPHHEEPPKAEQPEPSLPAERAQESAGARPNVDGKEAEPPAAFAVFWAAYPRKVQKQTALKAWRTLVKHGASDADILNAAAAYQTASARKHTPPDKIMHPATFLREDRWRDWLPPDGASYREAMNRGTGERSRQSDWRPMSYAEAVERFHGAGAVTVDIPLDDWREEVEVEQ